MAFPTGWIRLGIVTVDADQVSGSGDLANFPVPLFGAALAQAGVFDATVGAQPDGGDLRFTADAAGTTLLAHDIIHFDKDAGQADIRVKIPILSGSVDTPINVWVVGPNATEMEPAANSTYGREAVWADYEYVCALYGRAPTMDRTAQRRHHYYGQIPRATRSYVVAADRPTTYAGWPSMVWHATDRSLLLAFRDGGTSHYEDAAGYITVLRSAGIGRSWAARSTIGQADTTHDYRDSNLYVHAADGTIYLITTVVNPAGATGSNRTLKYYRSTDAGATWDSGTTLTSTNGQARGKPILLSTGLIAVPWYEINASAQMRPRLTTIDPSTQAKVDYTVDAAWNGYNEWSPIETSGVLRGFFRKSGADGIYSATCDVASLGSWSAIALHTTTSTMGPAEVQRISTGDILLAYEYERAIAPLFGAGANVQIRRSTDGGATLITGDVAYLVVEDEPIASGAGYYPTFAEVSPGLLAWAIYADSANNAFPTKIITGIAQLDSTGALTGWTESGTIPIKSSNSGGQEFIANIYYCPRQMSAASPLDYIHQNATFTLGALVKLDNYGQIGLQTFIGNNASADSANKGFLWGYDGTNDTIRLSRYLGSGVSHVVDSTANAITDTAMHLVHTVLNAGAPTNYVDAVSKGGSPSNSATTTGSATYGNALGRYNYSTPGGPLDGRMGWIYLHRSALSSDWIATETASLADTFATGERAPNTVTGADCVSQPTLSAGAIGVGHSVTAADCVSQPTLSAGAVDFENTPPPVVPSVPRTAVKCLLIRRRL